VLGNYENAVNTSLELMNNAIHAMRTCIVDDVHIGNRFADVAETMTQRMKSQLVRMVANGAPTTAAASRDESHSPMPSTEPTYMAPPNGLPTSHPATQQWANMQGRLHENSMHGNMQQYPSDSPFQQGSNGRMTPADFGPLAHTQIYNQDTNEHIIMPPPNFFPGQFGNPYVDAGAGSSGYNGNDDGNGTGMSIDLNGPEYEMVNDWYTVPLNPIVSQYGADVHSNIFGPSIGDVDLLDMYRSDI
jgi:hypothetical protein